MLMMIADGNSPFGHRALQRELIFSRVHLGVILSLRSQLSHHILPINDPFLLFSARGSGRIQAAVPGLVY